MIGPLNAAQTTFLGPSTLHTILLPLISTAKTTSIRFFDPDDNSNGTAITSNHHEMDHQQQNHFQILQVLHHLDWSPSTILSQSTTALLDSLLVVRLLQHKDAPTGRYYYY
jgi:hypothetical protein